MSASYRYHASTLGVWGHINRPFDEIIPVQASLSLPGTGGFGTARVDRFDFRAIVSFESVEALVSGSFDPDNHAFDSTATVTITGLNILDMVTADRVVARIAAANPEEPGKLPSITPIGSYFENLRIAGHPVKVDLATDTFHNLDTIDKVRQAYDEDQKFAQEFDKLTLSRSSAVPDFLRKYFPRLGKPGIAEPCRVTTCSLVRGIEGLPECLTPVGHLIRIRGFGIIRLAEFRITDGTRSVTMVQVDLGSGPAGSTGSGGASGGGSDP